MILPPTTFTPALLAAPPLIADPIVASRVSEALWTPAELAALLVSLLTAPIPGAVALAAGVRVYRAGRAALAAGRASLALGGILRGVAGFTARAADYLEGKYHDPAEPAMGTDRALGMSYTPAPAPAPALPSTPAPAHPYPSHPRTPHTREPLPLPDLDAAPLAGPGLYLDARGRWRDRRGRYARRATWLPAHPTDLPMLPAVVN